MPRICLPLPIARTVRLNPSLIGLLFGMLAVLGAQRSYASSCTLAGTFTSTDTIATPDNGDNGSLTKAGTYPSKLNVTGLTGSVCGVTLKLNGVTSNTTGNYRGLQGAQLLLVSPDGSHMLEIFGSPGDAAESLSGQSFTFCDANYPDGSGICASSYLPDFSSTIPSGGTFKPSSYNGENGVSAGFPSPGPGTISSSSELPHLDGTATLDGAFTGATANSISSSQEWSLYLVDYDGDPVTISGWTLKIYTLPLSTTTTTVSPSLNPVYIPITGNTTSDSATFTATVSGSSPTGTVTFSNNGVNLTCSEGLQPRALNGSQQATCTATFAAGSNCTNSTGSQGNFVCQGDNTITATYGGDSNNAGSSGTVDEVILAHTQNTANTGNTSTYCNESPFYLPGTLAASSTPQAYPSIIEVPSFGSSTVSDVTVQLNNMSGYAPNAQYLLVSPDGGHNLDFLDFAWEQSSVSGINLTIEDNAGQTPNPAGTAASGNYDPYDDESSTDTFPSSSTTATLLSARHTSSLYPYSVPGVPGTLNYPAPKGSSSNGLETRFAAATAVGVWELYPYMPVGQVGSVGEWCITLSEGTNAAVSLGTSVADQTTGQAVKFTATVTGNGSPLSDGTVTFEDNGVAPAGTSGGNNVVTPDANGHATFTTSSLTEGDHPITAVYSGDSTYAGNTSSTVVQRIDDATTASITGTNAYKYCNTGAVESTLSGSGTNAEKGAFTPNPSNIFVNNLPGTVSSLSVALNGFTTDSTETLNATEALLQGPSGTSGNNLDFFSYTGNLNESMSNANLLFEDNQPAVPTGSGWGSGTYAPSSYNSGADSFSSSSSGLYNAPSSITYAQSKGTSTLASQFTGFAGNGTWNLFFDVNEAASQEGATNGWCLNFTENPVTISPTLGHTGNSGTGSDFAQGESNAQINVTVAVGNSTGPTGNPDGSNPLKVVDTLPNGLTFASNSGTDWGTCSAVSQTVTCTNSDSISQGNSYPALTINVNVAAGASGTLSNSITVSGAGTSSTPANDSIPVDVATVTQPSNESATYSTSAQNVGMSATVTSNGSPVTVGTVTFTVYNGGTMIGSPVTSGTLDSSGVGTATFVLPGGTAAGTYTIDATYNGSGTYELSNNSATLTVNAFTPTFTWTPATTIIFGSAGTNVLNASVNCTSCGSISYTETPGGGGSAVAIATTTGLATGDYTITANFNPNANYGANSTTASLTVSGESVWVVNSGGGAAELAGNGYAITSSTDPGLNTAAAIDATGNVWTVGTGANLLESISQIGTVKHSVSSGGGLNTPSAIAADGNSELWVTNTGNNSVSLFLNNGSPESPSTGFTDSSLSTPSGVAIDLGGSVWIANQGNNSVTRFLGAATPIAPPSTSVKNNTTGAKP